MKRPAATFILLLVAVLTVATASAGTRAVPSVTTTTLPQADIDGPLYSVTLKATGGVKPYRWSLASGTLPRALKLSSGGVISGWPQNEGTWSFKVKVTDANGRTDTQALRITVVTSKDMEVWWPVNPRNFIEGQSFPAEASPLRVYRGAPPFTWSMTGELPGITIDPSTGYLQGTFTQAGTFNPTFVVTDAKGRTASKSFDFHVTPALHITTTTVPGAKVGQPYSVQLELTGGIAPFTWFVYSGSLPPGLAISGDGVISGTPNASGSYGFEIRVSDSSGPQTTGMGYTIDVAP